MAILFAILSIAIAIVGGLLFGVIGGFVAIAAGVAGFIFGLKKKKDPDRKGGVGSMVVSIIGLLIGLGVVPLFLGLASDTRKDAAEKGLTNLEQVADGLKFGVVGIAKKANDLGIDIDLVTEEMKELNK